ncbi:conserved domain protein [Eggerthella sp. HGA1]|nr:conserved domain protein [Eggerthella sp. HGA1]
MLLVGGRPSSGRAAVAILPGNGAAPPAPKWVDCENPP